MHSTKSVAWLWRKNGPSGNYTGPVRFGRTIFHKPLLAHKANRLRRKGLQDTALVGNPPTMLWIFAQIKPEHLLFGLGRYEERNSAVTLVG
jgi:hypothetical protein